MSAPFKNEQEPLFARESLFRQKLNQLRSTGEIQRNTANFNQLRFKDIEQSQYLNNVQNSQSQNSSDYVSKIALLDPLTELYNHNTICRILKDEVKRSQRYKHDLAVLALTIESLDKIAIQGGPIAFDAVVRGVARFLLRSIRDVDIPARYDREHFLLICPETNMEGALCLSERLCNRIRKENIADFGTSWQITMRTGIAVYPESTENHQQLLKIAMHSLNN